ncbi:MAG: SoxR reducing system RseC family protein [Woeseiaceae bacterium]|nr:SoxR reducing system RseC family protein [Woeseiaceae bacterium]
MKNPEGQVMAVSADAGGAVALLTVNTELACERCRAGRGCGAGLLGGRSQDRQVEARVTAGLEIEIGDIVSVSLEPRHLLRAAVMVYGYPLFGAVLAAIAALSLELGDVAAALFALTGLVTGMAIARYQLQSSHCLREFTPVVIERLLPVLD